METPAQPVVYVEAVYSGKIDVYIKCFNDLQIPVQQSLARYADWLKDFKQGPTGKESIVYGIYGIQELSINSCEKGMKRVAVLILALEPIDGIFPLFIQRVSSNWRLKNMFAASEITSRTLIAIKTCFRTQHQVGWWRTLIRQH